MAGVIRKFSTKYWKFVIDHWIKWSMVPKHLFFLDFWLFRKTWFLGITSAKPKMCFSVPSGIWLFSFSAKRKFSEIPVIILLKEILGRGGISRPPGTTPHTHSPTPRRTHPLGRLFGDNRVASPPFTSWREDEANEAKAKTKVNFSPPRRKVW